MNVTILAGNNTNNIATSFENYNGTFNLEVRATNVCGEGTYSIPIVINTCNCAVISKTTDGGLGSLRNAVSCANAQDTMVFDSTFLSQQFIQITGNPISISKDLLIKLDNNDTLQIEGINGAVFDITPAGSLTLKRAKIKVGQGLETRGIINGGNLDLENVIFNEPNTLNTVGPVILNKQGSVMTVRDKVKLKKE